MFFLLFPAYLNSQQIKDEELDNDIFEIIHRDDTSKLYNLINKNIDLSKRDTALNLNIFQYSIFWHKNKCVRVIFDYMLKNKNFDILNDEQVFKIAVLSGNYESLKLVLPYQNKSFLKNNTIDYFSNFVVDYNSFKDTLYNDSEYIRLIPDSADLKMLEIFLTCDWFDINKKNQNGETIGIKLRNYPHLISLLISNGLDSNIKDSQGYCLGDYLINELTESDFIYLSEANILEKIKTIKLIFKKGYRPSVPLNIWCLILKNAIISSNNLLISDIANDPAFEYDFSDCEKELKSLIAGNDQINKDMVYDILKKNRR